jgi:hypothetical protein
MSLMTSINRFLGVKPKAFIVDECDEAAATGANLVKSKNIEVDKFSNFKQLLYTLQSGKPQKYRVGLIHENGSKYSPQILSNFIKQIDPGIQLIVYKDASELEKHADSLSLT